MNPDVMVAAHNNAEWCDIVCRTHGITAAFYPHVWASPKRTPPFYPDAVTLDVAARAEDILELVDTSTGCSVKDSFAGLDLSSAGFRILFEGEWIHLAQHRSAPAHATTLQWRRVGDVAGLRDWEAAWRGELVSSQIFRPALLDQPTVVILGGYRRGRIMAGAIVNRSRAAIGVSNLFTTTVGDLGDAWSGCIATVGRAFPKLPIVGYESGDAIIAPHKLGFKSIGRLRIWSKEDGGGGGRAKTTSS